MNIERRFNSVEKKRKLNFPPDVILDIEFRDSLKNYNKVNRALNEKDAGLSARKTLDAFRKFLSVNFKAKYCLKSAKNIKQTFGPDFVEWSFRSELRGFLDRFNNVKELMKNGFVEIEFDNDEFAAIKECFLVLTSPKNKIL